jgi:hypothetical protein
MLVCPLLVYIPLVITRLLVCSSAPLLVCSFARLLVYSQAYSETPMFIATLHRFYFISRRLTFRLFSRGAFHYRQTCILGVRGWFPCFHAEFPDECIVRLLMGPIHTSYSENRKVFAIQPNCIDRDVTTCHVAPIFHTKGLRQKKRL